MIYILDPNLDNIYKDNQIWWWITNEIMGEVGWIIGDKGQITEWHFLGQTLDPKIAVYDKKIQRLCPDLINLMIIYLTHQE